MAAPYLSVSMPVPLPVPGAIVPLLAPAAGGGGGDALPLAAAGVAAPSAIVSVSMQKSNFTGSVLPPGTSSIAATMGCFAYTEPELSQHAVLNVLNGTKPPLPLSCAHQRSLASVAPFGPWICTRNGEPALFLTCTSRPLFIGTIACGMAPVAMSWATLIPTNAVPL